MANESKKKPSGQKTHPGFLGGSKDLSTILASALKHHQSGSLQKAAELYTSILDDHPDHPDALHLLGVVSYQKGEMDTAVKLISRAVHLNPNAPEYKCNLGNVFRELGRNEEAIACYKDAIRLNPNFPEAHNNLGSCLRSVSRVSESIDCYKKALDAKPDYVAAYINLGNVFRETGAFDQAIDSYWQAVTLNPRLAEVYHSLGSTYWDKGDYDKAMMCFRKATEIDPAFAQAHLSLSRLLRNSGSIQEAIASCRKAIKAGNSTAFAHHFLGTLYYETGKYADACECFERELGISPEDPQALNSLGKALNHTGKPDDAISFFHKAIKNDPDFAEAYSNLGIALHSTGRPGEAIVSYEKAIALDPEFAQAYNNLGSALHAIHRTEEAIRSFRQAISIKPDFAEAYNNLGIAHMDSEQFDDAHASFRKALDINPGLSDAHINSGNTYREQCRYSEALSCYQKALELSPRNINALTSMAYIFTAQGRMEESIHCYQQAQRIDPNDAATCSNFLFSLHYQYPIDPIELFRQHEEWGRKYKRGNPNAHANDKTPGRRLRVGYMSPDFRTHSVAYFIEPILASHNNASFEIFCYSDVAFPDETTDRMRTFIRNWRDISLLNDEQVERLIRNDGIDILIDLTGHTAKNRLSLFVLEPAPIQVTYLGYPDTTGLPAMHYRITDALADPVGMTDHLYTEKLVRLPGCFLCYRPPAETPDVGRPPVKRTDIITFGSFNNRSKITAGVVDTWSKILRTIPNSRLILKAKSLSDAETKELLLEMFTRNGVCPERIGFVGSIPVKFNHLDLYNDIDIALDTFPYNGTTTTCEALWMGVPVIVLKGDIHMSRVGVSLLTKAGMEGFIADTTDDYVEKAVNLAHDQEKLAQLRERQRDVMANSLLMDAHSFSNGLENEFRKMWIKWCTQNSECMVDIGNKPVFTEMPAVGESLQASTASALNKEGENYFGAGRLEDAKNAFIKALEVDPTCVAALNNLGVLCWHHDDVLKAVHYFEQALSLDSENDDAAFNLEQIRKARQNTCEEQHPASPEGGLGQSDDSCLTITAAGGIQVCVPPSMHLMTPYILMEQEDWFEDEINYLRKVLQPGMNIIDIGANYGLYTLSSSQAIGPTGKVWAFEPTSSTASFLRRSISINQMTNIELFQAGLSDKKGMAKLSLNPNSETNSLVTQAGPDSNYEIVQILSLDECTSMHHWYRVDFIKLDAEGQELNIVSGGKQLLSEQSPLVMFELKHGDNINTELIHAFSALGYRPYRLIPGLEILVPVHIDKPLDSFQLNLFCCKSDRAQLLEERGLLITHGSPPLPIGDSSLWRGKLKALPYFSMLMGAWASFRKEKTIPGWDHYENSLNYYVMAHRETEPAHSRFACLLQSCEEASSALDMSTNLSRLLTYARILSELGQRKASNQVTDTIMNLLGSGHTLEITEPFIPASQRFDKIEPRNIKNWVIASILEHKEKIQAFSSFYTGRISLTNLETLRSLGHQTSEMERRRQLIRMRYGLQDGPVPDILLQEKAKDNMNPDLWKSRKFHG